MVGKFSFYMFECIIEYFSVDFVRTFMVGDRLEIDIFFGYRCGMIIVFTFIGVFRLEEVEVYLAVG